MAIIGLSVYCNNSGNPTAPAASGLVGVWTGATSRTGGGGCVKDDAGNCTVSSGDTLWNYDSMGVVLTITKTKYSIVRGDKNWGSSDYGRDSSKEVGSWKIAGNKAIFTPTDSCLWKNETHPWTVDDGIYKSCLPPDTLTIDTTGNTWNTQIVNDKLTISQQITLTKQH
jgi:hypothetical protein